MSPRILMLLAGEECSDFWKICIGQSFQHLQASMLDRVNKGIFKLCHPFFFRTFICTIRKLIMIWFQQATSVEALLPYVQCDQLSLLRDWEIFAKMMMMRVLVAVFVPLTIIATILRFVARGKKKVALGLDDFFALLALITFCALLGVSYWGESLYPICTWRWSYLRASWPSLL